MLFLEKFHGAISQKKKKLKAKLACKQAYIIPDEISLMKRKSSKNKLD